jgi:prephenate dehydrogenase
MSTPVRRAAVIGTGLVGGSIGMALRARGWHVTGRDADPERSARAVERGALDAVGDDPAAEITFVATPVGHTIEEVRRALATGPGLVTDVGSVKRTVTQGVRDPRFVGGHPMAGSEQVGIEGARADLFTGAVWVLTPDHETDGDAYVAVRTVVASLGAEVLAVPADHHDALVAVVSHVPHLTAATLMSLADTRSTEHQALLRLAAGGFRDMTRIAAGDPGIWPDICVENSAAITSVLDTLIGELGRVRDQVASHDRSGLVTLLSTAQRARRALPTGAARAESLSVVRVPMPDRTGELARVLTSASELGVNVFDLEIAHSAEGDEGVAILVVASDTAEALRSGLADRGYHPAVDPLE